MAKLAKPKVRDLSTAERISRARAKLEKLVDHLIHVISLRETNKIVAYSDVLAKQIPPSRGANAFNLLRDSMVKWEFVRLSVVWDPVRDDDLDLESIPAVVQLVDDPKVIWACMRATYRWRRDLGGSLHLEGDEETRAALLDGHRKIRRDLARQEAKHAGSKLRQAIRVAKRLENSFRIESLRDFRNKYLAHSLERTLLERQRGMPIAPPRYGDLDYLLWRTIGVVNALYITVAGTGFHWAGSFEIARENAEELWLNTHIVIPSRRSPEGDVQRGDDDDDAS